MEPNYIKAIIWSIGLIAVVFVLYWAKKYIEKLEREYVKEKINVVIEKTKTGYSCYCEQIDGVVAVGDNVPALKELFEEALEFHLTTTYCSHEFAGLMMSDFEINYIE